MGGAGHKKGAELTFHFAFFVGLILKFLSVFFFVFEGFIGT